MTNNIFSKENLLYIGGSLAMSIISSFLYDLSKNVLLNHQWLIYLLIFIIISAYTFILFRFFKSKEKQLAKDTIQDETQKFMIRTGHHHNFEHYARNLAVKLMSEKIGENRFDKCSYPIPLTGEVHNHYCGEIIGILEDLVRMFQHLVPPGTKLWACIRERRSDDHYYTWVRAGSYTSSRVDFSEAIYKNSKTIINLKDSYRLKKDCVIITGSGAIGKLTGREPVANDDFKEDLSVLMGAVLSKSWNGHEFDKKKLNWILCINADREDVFNSSHIPLMKCCNDTFSWLLNAFIRKSDEEFLKESLQKL